MSWHWISYPMCRPTFQCFAVLLGTSVVILALDISVQEGGSRSVGKEACLWFYTSREVLDMEGGRGPFLEVQLCWWSLLRVRLASSWLLGSGITMCGVRRYCRMWSICTVVPWVVLCQRLRKSRGWHSQLVLICHSFWEGHLVLRLPTKTPVVNINVCFTYHFNTY